MARIFEQEKEKAGQTLFYCALVFRCPLKTFEDVRDYLLNFSDAELTFQTKSVDYLWISKTPPPKPKSLKEFF